MAQLAIPVAIEGVVTIVVDGIVSAASAFVAAIATEGVITGAMAAALTGFGIAEADAAIMAEFMVEDGEIQDLITGILRQLVHAATGLGPVAFLAQIPTNDQDPASMLDHVVLKKFADTIAANVQKAAQKQVNDDLHEAVQKAGDETKAFLASEKSRILKVSLIPFYGWVEGPIEVSHLKSRAMDLFRAHAKAKILTLEAEYKGKSPKDVHTKYQIDKLLVSQEWKDFMLSAAAAPSTSVPAPSTSMHLSEVVDSPRKIIESCHTGRYLFDAAPDGDVRSIREQEGGWIHKNNVPVLTVDANYYNRAYWTIVPVEGHPGKVFIESCHTGRYLFDAAPDGDVRSIREQEGGWVHKNNVPVLTVDANYYNRAYWTITNV